MNIERTRMRRLGLALLLLVVTATASAERRPEAKATVGRAAPSFSLPDTNGRTCDLADAAGRIVVIEWINTDCPYVKRHYIDGAMLEVYRMVQAVAPDTVWIAIDSTKDATAQDRAAWREKHGVPYPVLLDSDGTVGRLYNARRTPHMFVIDAKGVLRYHGAIDDDRLGLKPRSEVTNYVVDAVRQITSEQTVTPSFVKPYGCSVKYGHPKKQAAGATTKQ
jgi:peroxiredoxin